MARADLRYTAWPEPRQKTKMPSPRPTLRWQLQFLRGFLGGNRALTGPHTAIVDVTDRCNLHCFACPRHAPDAPKQSTRPQDLPWDDFQKLCRECQTLGVAKMVFIGQGEPMFNPRLPDMIRLAKSAGMALVLITNGTLLDATAAEALLSAGLDELRVSLWASTPEEYAHNCAGNSPELFARVVSGLKTLSRMRRERRQRLPRIVLHRPIEREFFHALEGMLDLARDTGCDALSFSPLKPLAGMHRERGLHPDEEKQLIPILKRLHSRARKCGLATNVPETLRRYHIGEQVWRSIPCTMGWIDVRIRTNGDVLVCGTCQASLGNIHNSSLREIWNGAAFQRFRAAARSEQTFSALAPTCDCAFCCHASTNARLHRFLRWIPRRGSNTTLEPRCNF